MQEAINLDIPVCVETEKAAAFLYANDKYKQLADNATFNPTLMSAAEMAEYEMQGQDFIQQAEQAEQLADEAVNLATEDMDKSDLDILADSKVEELMQAGYSERESTNYAKVFAAHAQRFAPLWGESPQDFMNRVKITEEQSYDGSISKKFTLDKRNVYGQSVNDDVDVSSRLQEGQLQTNQETEREPLVRQGMTRKPDSETVKVVTLPDVHAPEFERMHDFATWAKEILEASGGDVVISSTEQTVQFSTKNVRASTKRSRAKTHRDAYLALRELIENAEYDKYEPKDEKHPNSGGQDVYYSALNMGGKLYSVKIKVDVLTDEQKQSQKARGKNNAVDVDYKDHKLTEIEIAPALYHGVLENKQSMQEASAISNVSLGVLREKVKPSGISENTLYQIAYHGTPYNFDEFSLQEQRGSASPRGLIRFNPKTQEAMITVFKDKKDFSTVLHETSHYFLQTLANAYQMENAPAWVKENFETLAREMGFDPSQPLSTETHERFARLGEAYFREGKAPREELAGAFNMFKGWLTSLYRYVSKLLGRDSLNDEIRSVFDNMLATEEQIEQAKRNREKESSIQILASKFNLNQEQLDLLQKEKDRADKKASAIILLNKIQGLKNAEENARKEVSEIVRTSDYYNSLDTIRKNGKISFESLLGFLDEDTANSIKTKWKDYFSYGENAMSLDEAAIYFNTSAEQFINLLFNELPAKDYIDRYVQNARNKFEASFNADVEYMGLDNDVLNLEIELMGGQKIDLKALDTALSERADRKAGEDLDRDYERLKMSIEKKSSMLRDLLNKKEDTATKKEILKLKEQMRIMRADLKANYEKKMERDKTVRAVRKEVKSKSVPEEYRQQILQFVQKKQGLGTAGMTARMDTQSWQEFKKEKFGADNKDLGMELAAPPVPEWLENLSSPIPLGELSTADLKDLRAGIKSLAHMGRVEQKLITEKDNRNVQEIISECSAAMGGISQKKPLTDKEKDSFLGGTIKFVRGALSSMSLIRQMVMRADGYTKEATGPNSKHIVRKMHEAQVEEYGLSELFQKEISSILQPIVMKGSFTKEFVIEGIPLPKKLQERWGGKFNKDRVFAVALNMGNKGNLDALMAGYGWSMEDLTKIVSVLTAEELSAVQKIWDMLENLRPHIEKTYREMNGVDMKKVEAEPINLVSGEGQVIEMRGGYYPLQFDPDLAPDIQKQNEIDNILNANAFLPTKPTVRKGMTVSRTGSKKPPYLSFVNVVNRHLQDSIKYATHAARVRDVYKIISNAQYRDSYVSAFGIEEYEQRLCKKYK